MRTVKLLKIRWAILGPLFWTVWILWMTVSRADPGEVCTQHLIHAAQATTVSDLVFGEDVRHLGLVALAVAYGYNEFEFARKFYSRGGENIGLKFLKRADRINPKLRPLVFHPGLVLRQNQFFRFLKEHPDLSANPQAAYVEFRKSLGTVTAYRTLVLPNGVFHKMQSEEHNILASDLHQIHWHNPELSSLVELTNNSLVHTSNADQMRYKNWDLRSLNLYNMSRDQFKFGGGTLLLSVTQIKDIALAVGFNIYLSYGPVWRETVNVYLFKAEVPILDTLHLPHVNKTSVKVQNPQGEIAEFSYGPAVESFLMFGIDHDEILTAKKLTPESRDFRNFYFVPKKAVRHK